MLGSMRIGLGGKIEERKVLTNVVVVHRGNRVRVGSGFSAEERVRFGKDPSLIVGKTITVQFFEESKTSSNTGTGNGDDEASSSSLPSTDRITDGTTHRAKASSIKERKSSDDDEGDGGDAVWSLRFPTVKAIYGEGPRQL